MSKRILFLIKGLGRGGAEQLLVSAAPYLDRSRFDYEVAYLLPHKDALVGELESFGVPGHCLDGARGVGWIRRLQRLVRERHIDLVHVHSPYAALGARLAPALRSVPLVCTEHVVWDCYRSLTKWANLLTFTANDHVFTVSDEVRASMRYPGIARVLPRPPLETLYYGLDFEEVRRWGGRDGVRAEFGIAEDAPLVGTVANFKNHKGYEYLVEAAAKVHASVPEVRFLLVGQGPLEQVTRRRAAEAGLEDVMIFAGFRTDAPRLIAALDVFTLASLHEGLSIALLEAMALAKPVVITAAGGNPEAVEHERSGLVVPPRRPAELADGILRVLADNEVASRLAGAAAQRATRFDIRSSVARTETVYDDLLKGSRR